MRKKLSFPKVGDDIYVEGSASLSHGCDDVAGGLAQVVAKVDENDGTVQVFEHPGHNYDWNYLSAKQKELKDMYGKKRARPTPDMSAMHNDGGWMWEAAMQNSGRIPDSMLWPWEK